MIKFLNSASKSVTGAAITIAAATLLSRVIGLARDRVFAHYFGAGPVLDAYYAAFKIPDLLYNLLIVGALTAGFIPAFTRLFYESDDRTPAWNLASNVITIVALALLALAGIGIAAMPLLAKIIAPGFSLETRALVVVFSRIMFLSPILLGISMVFGGVLQSLRQFVLYALAPVFYNIGIIMGTLVLTRTSLGLAGLAWGVVLGALLHLGVQVYGAYQAGYRWRPQLRLRDATTRLIGKLMLPRTLGLAMAQVNAVVVTILASLLSDGSVTVYNLANNLQAVPAGLIGIPFALAVFPVLAAAAVKNTSQFREQFASTMRQIIFLIIPCSIVFLLLRAQIVRVILGSGQFNWTATITTADAVAFFALGLWAQSLIPLLARGFYAFHNTKTPFVIGLIAELFTIIAALIFMRPLGVAGLALASTLGAAFNAVALFTHLRPLSGPLEEEHLLQLIYKVAIAGIFMALTIQILKYPLAKILDLDRFWGILLHGLISGSAGLLVYGGLCRLFKLEEMLHLQKSFKRRWLKLWNIPAGIDEAEGL